MTTATFSATENGNRGSPYSLDCVDSYTRWREAKLSEYPLSAAQLMVPVTDPFNLSAREKADLLAHFCKANMAFYRMTSGDVADKGVVRALGAQFGLHSLDDNLRSDENSITSLRIMPQASSTHYIPYTNKSLNWHTDGYYNAPAARVRAFVMHCVTEANTGGGNLYLDPEIAYLLLREENPEYIRALMQPDAMTIPANVEDGVEIRPAQSGPVFSVDPANGSLHMRYTARTRSIEWKDDEITQAAAGFLGSLLNSDLSYIFRYKLASGEGIICNNVIHSRDAFEDTAGQERLLYRARFHERIQGCMGAEMINAGSGV